MGRECAATFFVEVEEGDAAVAVAAAESDSFPTLRALAQVEVLVVATFRKIHAVAPTAPALAL